MADYIFKPSSNAAEDFTNSVAFEGFDVSETVPVPDGIYDVYEKTISSFTVQQVSAEFDFATVGEEPVITATDGNVSVSIASGPYAGTYTQRVTDGAALTVAMIAAAPTSVILPQITGAVQAGQTLTALPGIWLYAGDDPGDQTWAWQNATDGSLGDTDLSYTVQPTDVGDTIRIDETFGGATVSSAGIVSGAGSTADAFVDANWSVSTGASANELDITIVSVPADNGDAITDIEYDIDASGTWISLGTASAGTTTVTMAAPATSYALRLRAVNGVGNASAGNSEAATSGALAAFGVPSDYAETLHWWSFKAGEGGLYQDTRKVTPVTSAGQTVKVVVDQVGAIDLQNSNCDNTYAASDAMTLSGTNNVKMTTSAPLSFSGNIIFLMSLKSSDTAGLLVSKLGGTIFAGAFGQGSTFSGDIGFGASVGYQAGTSVISPDTRGALHTAWSTGLYTVAGITGVDYGASNLCQFFDFISTGLAMTGEVKDFVIVDASISAGDLNALISDLEARAA